MLYCPHDQIIIALFMGPSPYCCSTMLLSLTWTLVVALAYFSSPARVELTH